MNSVSTVGTRRTHVVGLIAIVISWIGATVSVPYSKILMDDGTGVNAEDLLVVRSVTCMLVAIFVSGGAAVRFSNRVVVAGLLVGASSIGFYEALRTWSISPVSVLISTVPLVSLAIALWEGKHVPVSVSVAVVALIAGVFLVLDLRKGEVSLQGLAWTISSVVLGGFGFDQWSKCPQSSTVSQKCFWLGASVLPFSWIMNSIHGHHTSVSTLVGPGILWPLVLFTVPVTAYVFASITPFSPVGKMNPVVALALMQVGTPFTIKGAEFFHHDGVRSNQWVGAFVVIVSAAYIGRAAIIAGRSRTIVVSPSPSG